MKERLAGTFPIVLAFIIPLAGLLLAMSYGLQGDRPFAIRVAVATLAGAIAWYILLTS